MKQRELKNKNITRAATYLLMAFSIIFVIFLARFMYIQVTGRIGGGEIKANSHSPYNKRVELPAERGKILSSDGEVLAIDTSSYTVTALLGKNNVDEEGNPFFVKDVSKTAKVLAPILDMTEQRLTELLTSKKEQVELGPGGRNISAKQKRKIEEKKLPGITFMRDTKRYYPNGTFASHVIGYTKYSDEKNGEKSLRKGEMGIEKYLDDQLRETNGSVTSKVTGSGKKSLPLEQPVIVKPENGTNVTLTIDSKIQAFLETSMEKVANTYEPEKMMAIVMDPKTGRVLAMSSRPSFDLNKKDIKNFYNDSISYPFEPGSTMKTFTLAAAIEEGVYNGKEKFQSGAYRVGGATIRDHNYKGWGDITYDEGIQRSSNVAIVKLAKEKLGFEKYRTYLDKFGFEQPTNIMLPGEQKGKILFNYEVEKATTSFGQGTTVTAIQLMQAMTAIANDGKMMQPQIVKSYEDPDTGKVTEVKSKVVGAPISKETAKKTLKVLEGSVSGEDEFRTGKAYQLEQYSAAGKTGTAQLPNPKGGGYLYGDQEYLYSFMGAAPAENPELIMYVAMQKPKVVEGVVPSTMLSEVFNPVMKSSLHYLKIKPTEKKEDVTVEKKLTETINMDTKDAVEQLKEDEYEVVVLGDGDKVVRQDPIAESSILTGEKVVLKTNGNAKMVDLTGWSLRDVQKLARLYDLNLTIKGNGYVVSQSIKVDAPFHSGAKLTIELKK